MKKIILISGVTGSIGRATVYDLAKTGAKVVLLARNEKKLEILKNEISRETGNHDIDYIVADLSSINDVKKAITLFKEKNNQLDALVNIAAVYNRDRIVTKDNLETMFAINHLAPFILTNGLLDLLKMSASGRVVTVSAPSTTKLKFDDLQGATKFSALSAFGGSKMMNLMFTYALSRRLKNTKVQALVLHPGVVKSELINEMPTLLKFIFGLLSGKPDAAANRLMQLTTSDDYANSNGKFFKFNGKEMKSSSYSYDQELQEKLWAISEKLI